MITVKFSATAKAVTGEDQIEIDAPTVRRLVRLLDERWPGLGEQLTDGMAVAINGEICLLYTSPSPRDGLLSRMPSSA